MNKPNLIVIDDEANVGAYICDIASSVGFQCTDYQDGYAFIKQDIENESVIVLDLMMPDMDGVEIIRFLATQDKSFRLILVSGVDATVLHSAQELAEEYQLKVVAVLQKPFLPRALKDILSGLLKNQQQPPSVSDCIAGELSAEDLALAIKQGHIVAYFQPQISFKTGEILGFEALARWLHPQKGVISPQCFIPIAEENELMYELTWSMLRQVTDLWQQQQLHYSVSINMPARLLKSQALSDDLAEVMRQHRLDPSQLIIEITENGIMEEFSKSLESLIRMRMHGFRLSIDDFGTAYSSLVQLYRAPFTELKIDMSFVSKIEHDPEAQAIVEATILLAQKLKLQVVAEGVENQAIFDQLAGLEADIAQGYHIAKPIPAEQLMGWIEEYSGVGELVAVG
ncbi:MAG: EAL domain-containing protein [Methyloprofundus sp.]|nr:EAL domain-containing protein [Methyloprofundus sp.]